MGFDKLFHALTGHDHHFPWQRRLYKGFIRGDMPNSCDIPTGLGKTSVIAIWLLALAGKEPSVQIPRRLVYVVNRRTIVDQSTEVVLELHNRLKKAEDDTSSQLYETAMALKSLCAVANTDGGLFSVSTLRGELADNLQWRFDPVRPAVMIGTVDMIGSKLLFSGYGDTRRVRPLNAGLVGCDTLLVHDEAHLTPAFSLLLRRIEDFYNKANAVPGIPPFRVLELSATTRRGGGNIFRIDSADHDDDIIRRRLFATKTLHLHAVPKPKDQIEKIVALALKHSSVRTRVVVFIQSPEDATKIHDMLVECLIEKAAESWCNEHNSEAVPKKEREDLQVSCKALVSILTGEIRGRERDMLLEKQGMMPFTGKAAAEQTVYLVSTSAGEVGMDLHADHMVSDLTTLDSMIQRLGRVNRFGQTESRVDVVYHASLDEKGNKRKDRGTGFEEERVATSVEDENNDAKQNEKDKSHALQKTLALIHKHSKVKGSEAGLDVCPAALIEILKEKDAAEAFAPVPDTVDTTDILLDLWSQTSLTDIPARPEVSPWLHGIQPNLPETWMAWRQEVSLLGDSDLTDEDISYWFQKFSVSSRETLRKPTYRLKWTGTSEKKWIEDHVNDVVFVLSSSGQCRNMTLAELAGQGGSLNFATIVFPTKLGGLSENGFFDISTSTPATDVADGSFQRIIIERRGDWYRLALIDGWSPSEPVDIEYSAGRPGWHRWTTLKEAVRAAENNFDKKPILKLKVRQAKEWEDEPHEWWLLLLREIAASNRSSSIGHVGIQTVDEHNKAVAETIRSITDKTSLPDSIKEALWLAAAHHDLGKFHFRWQTAAGHDPGGCYAKPASGGIDWRILDGYRHELSSIMRAVEIEEIRNHPESDLILHLIATHHGWARPHFDDRAFPPEMNEEARNRTNLEVMMRFIRLQERFSYWQLAWLESLLRRADGIASMQQGQYEEASDE